MKIQLWSVGKPHDAYVKTGIDDFSKRLNNYFNAQWQIIPVPKQSASLSDQLQKKAEIVFVRHK